MLFRSLTRVYTGGVRWALRNILLSFLAFAVMIGGVVWLFRVIPGAFVPGEDQGYVFGAVLLPDGASLQRTARVGETLQQSLAKNPAVEHVFLINGFDLISGGAKTSSATLFLAMKPWEERTISAQQKIGRAHV